ncbi:MAG TPA: UPF0223 family protein [Candidatus Avamphibacillus intestinigallinarum]|nr:UPF0223 family protein [Candidatus Avamphibacillus intestinigallinarum]
MGYHYPLEEEWTKSEIIDVVNFYNCIEKAYESRIKAEDVLLAYQRFKEIVPAKSVEKQHFQAFEKGSGYVPFQVIKRARAEKDNVIKM